METLDRRIQENQLLVRDRQTEMDTARREIEALQQQLAQGRGEQDRLAAALSSMQMQREALQRDIASARASSETSSTLVEETVARLEALREQAKEKDQRLLSLRQEEATCRAFVGELTERLEELANTKNGYLYKQKGREET